MKFTKGQGVPEFMVILIVALLLFSAAFYMLSNQTAFQQSSIESSQLYLLSESIIQQTHIQSRLPIGTTQTIQFKTPPKTTLMIQNNRITLSTEKGDYYSQRLTNRVLDVELTDWDGSLNLSTELNGVRIS